MGKFSACKKGKGWGGGGGGADVLGIESFGIVTVSSWEGGIWGRPGGEVC